ISPMPRDFRRKPISTAPSARPSARRRAFTARRRYGTDARWIVDYRTRIIFGDCNIMDFIAAPPHQRLEECVTDLLEGSLGLSILPGPVSRARSLIRDDYWAGLQIGLLYALFFCAIPWLLFIVSGAPILKFPTSLFYFQVYGSFWSGWATASSRLASS